MKMIDIRTRCRYRAKFVVKVNEEKKQSSLSFFSLMRHHFRHEDENDEESGGDHSFIVSYMYYQHRIPAPQCNRKLQKRKRCESFSFADICSVV